MSSRPLSFKAALARPLSVRHASLICSVLSLLVLSVAMLKGFNVLPEGPSEEMARTTRELSSTGIISSPRFLTLHTELLARSREDGGTYWQDVYSMSTDGAFYPAHGVLTSVIAVPFYLILGDLTFPLLPQLFVGLAFFGIFGFVKTITDISISPRDIIIAALGTPLMFHATAFGYDVMAASLIVASLWALVTFPPLGGVMLASTLFLRPTNVFFLPLVFASMLGSQNPRRPMALAILACSVVVLIFLAFNWEFWGSAFTTINERMPQYVAGEVDFYNPAMSLATLSSEWSSKLFAKDIGFIAYTPVILLLPWALMRLRRSRFAHFSFLCTCIIVANIIVIFSFHCWMCSVNGNRFLLPTSLLSLILVLLAFRVEARPSLLG